MTNPPRNKVESERRDRPDYNVGPFMVSGENLTMLPGVYILRKPLMFKVSKSTSIEGVEYESLPDGDPGGHALEHVVAEAHPA